MQCSTYLSSNTNQICNLLSSYRTQKGEQFRSVHNNFICKSPLYKSNAHPIRWNRFCFETKGSLFYMLISIAFAVDSEPSGIISIDSVFVLRFRKAQVHRTNRVYRKSFPQNHVKRVLSSRSHTKRNSIQQIRWLYHFR